MINFIKNLLGFGSKETVKEILTPQAPYKLEPVATTYVEPAKPTFKPAVTEGKAKGGNNAVKHTKPKNKKPQAPAKPKTAKPANKPKAKRK